MVMQYPCLGSLCHILRHYPGVRLRMVPLFPWQLRVTRKKCRKNDNVQMFGVAHHRIAFNTGNSKPLLLDALNCTCYLTLSDCYHDQAMCRELGGSAYGGLAHNTSKKQLLLVALCYPGSRDAATYTSS